MCGELAIIKERLLNAVEENEPLRITGGNSKSFMGRTISGTPLTLKNYQGIVRYEPTELYITVKAGTALEFVTETLAANKQMLAFEPPLINRDATIGGTVATGISGPRRPYTGSVRDYILGIRCLNGLGKELSFGGQVMKNVAGYDLSRLLTGSYGTLGIILEVSIKVLPMPEYEASYYKAINKDRISAEIHALMDKGLPVSACCYDGENLFIRLAGTEKIIKTYAGKINLDKFSDGERFWNDLCRYKLPFFSDPRPLWRLSVPANAQLDVDGAPCLLDWGGLQYWLKTEKPPAEVFKMARAAGGQAMLLHGGEHDKDVFQPLPDALLKIHRGLKAAFDPRRILNPGKIYRTL